MEDVYRWYRVIRAKDEGELGWSRDAFLFEMARGFEN